MVGTMVRNDDKSELCVREGSVLVYRIFDVADEIDLVRAEERLKALAEPTRLRLSRTAPRHIQISDPPVSVSLGPVVVPLPNGALGAEVTARVYDYGAVSITLSLPAAGASWSRLQELSRALWSGALVDGLAQEKLEMLLATLGPALQKPHRADVREDYTIYFVSAFDRPLKASELLERADLAALLLAEPEPERLASAVRESALRYALSYYQDDLTVIDWNAAFVYEPSGDRDVADILEYATSQLLELRYYDDLLDRELDEVYDKVGLRARAWSPFLPSSFPELARYLTALLVEVTDLTEKVENSLKVIDDLFLAKVYHAAVDRFRIAHWQRSVHRKLALVQSIHQVVQNRIHGARSLLLELTVVLLILLEIVLALFKVK